MKERLIEFLKYLGIGQNKFAESVGLSRGYVNNIGDNITMKSVNKIVQVYPELNKNWLLTGEGEMLSGGQSGGALSEAGRRDEENQTLSASLEHKFDEIIAIEKTNAEINKTNADTNKMNAETNKMNAESFNKVADSHVALVDGHVTLVGSQSTLVQSNDTLVKNNDKLIDIIKEMVTPKGAGS